MSEATNQQPAFPDGGTIGRTPSIIAEEIRHYDLKAGAALYEIGRRLNEAKQLLVEKGKWSKWLKSEANYTEKTAQRLMKVAKELPDPTLMSALGIGKVSMLLSLPKDQQEVFMNTEFIIPNVGLKKPADMTSLEFANNLSKFKKSLNPKVSATENDDCEQTGETDPSEESDVPDVTYQSDESGQPDESDLSDETDKLNDTELPETVDFPPNVLSDFQADFDFIEQRISSMLACLAEPTDDVASHEALVAQLRGLCERTLRSITPTKLEAEQYAAA